MRFWILERADCARSPREAAVAKTAGCGRGPAAVRIQQSKIQNLRAFTLIEILVVVAIMAIVMTISVPFLHNAISKRMGINGAVKDVQEACKLARDWAILQQTTQELRIRPADRVFEVGAASGGDKAEGDRAFSPDLEGKDWANAARPR